MSRCILLSVYPQIRIGCFAKLMIKSAGMMQHMTMQKKHTSCLPCFLKFVNSVLPVLGTAIGALFIMIKKKKAGKVTAF